MTRAQADPRPAVIVVGVIVAGGRSRRFGSEKALADFAGRPLIAHVARVLAGGCRTVAVNAPPAGPLAEWARDSGLALAPDPVGVTDGPLAGVLAGLDWAAGEGADLLATAPCDTPLLPEALVETLCAALTAEAGAAVAACGGELEPLCALWRVSRRDELRGLLHDGRHPAVREALEALGAARAAFPDPHAFTNVNTADDLDRMRS
jgi:molybdopterin-guanine dinucleotide biosynthesis protein A